MCSDSSAVPLLDSKCQEPDRIYTGKSERQQSGLCFIRFVVVDVSVSVICL